MVITKVMEKKSIEEIFEYINRNNCLFLAVVGSNFNYICVNAFIHKLHEELNHQRVTGVVINLRDDPNAGHSFEEDAFRFPDYCDIKVFFLSKEKGKRSIVEKTKMGISALLKRISRNKNNSVLYILTSGPDINLIGLAGIKINSSIHHVYISSGGWVGPFRNRMRLYFKEVCFQHLEKLIADKEYYFRPFDFNMKSTKYAKFFREAVEYEQIHLIGDNPDEKYVVYVSQSGVYSAYNQLVFEVLEEIRNLGYTIYIKPHTHERVVHYPQKEEYNILKKGYAIESVVGSARKKPDMIVGFCSTSMFALSAWLEIPCCSLINRIPKSEWSGSDKFTVGCIQSGEYPNLMFYDKEILMRKNANG